MLLTYGHGTESAERTVQILRSAGVDLLLDVRSFPGSRANPQFGLATMKEWLAQSGIQYAWDKRLGGRRPCPDDSPDIAWDYPAFRGYATHMRTPEFGQAVEEALILARSYCVALMCCETLWWKCHRRMIADFVQVARATDIRHLMHDGTLAENHPIGGIRLREDGLLVYDNVR